MFLQGCFQLHWRWWFFVHLQVVELRVNDEEPSAIDIFVGHVVTHAKFVHKSTAGRCVCVHSFYQRPQIIS